MVISARFPVTWFDRLRDGVKVWAPFYTYHKIMAGHLDMYTLAGNNRRLKRPRRWRAGCGAGSDL